MDMFTRFNSRAVNDRRIDTLIGLAQGITADQQVVQAEAEFLHKWLCRAQMDSSHPVTCNLLEKVAPMLEDGVLDSEEASELLRLLRLISGEEVELDEVSKTSTLPVNQPAPAIEFEGRSFLFTGTCAFGSRRECQEAVASLGGMNAKSVTKKLDYLVLGTYVTDSWAHESFGRKIEKALEYRDSGLPIIIITEEHWANEAGF
ncbi:MAG: BRCT domain-containing protein [Pontibacterium sp.]